MAEREFRPMGIGDILDTGVKLYKGNFGRFLGAAAVVYVPLALLFAFVQSLMALQMQAAAAQAEPGGMPDGGLLAGGVVILFVTVAVFFLATMLVNAALIKMVSEAYLGRAVGIGETYSFVSGRIGTVIAASILSTLIILVGYVLLIVPGIIFSLWFAFVAQAVVAEGTGAVGSLKRSRALASGNLGKIFGLGLILWIVGIVVGYIFGRVTGAVVQGTGAGATFLETVLGQGANIVLQPFFSACWILLYYDLRIRKEGFDLEMMAKSLGTALPEQPSA